MEGHDCLLTYGVCQAKVGRGVHAAAQKDLPSWRVINNSTRRPLRQPLRQPTRLSVDAPGRLPSETPYFLGFSVMRGRLWTQASGFVNRRLSVRARPSAPNEFLN